ncbi:MAG: hypothetical protein L6R37_008443 [Teloschistes peruensis]|nr:MAG: hypothetical protein L6R37_008443 [Teloschistes peruensis]
MQKIGRARNGEWAYKMLAAHRICVESLKWYRDDREHPDRMANLTAWKSINGDQVNNNSSGYSCPEQPNGKPFPNYDYKPTPPPSRPISPKPDPKGKKRGAAGSGSEENIGGEMEEYRLGAFKNARATALRSGDIIPLRVDLIDPDTASELPPPRGTANQPQVFSWKMDNLAEDSTCRRMVLTLPTRLEHYDVWELFLRDVVEPARMMLPPPVLKGRKVREIRGVLEEKRPKELDVVESTCCLFNGRTLLTWLAHATGELPLQLQVILQREAIEGRAESPAPVGLSQWLSFEDDVE